MHITIIGTGFVGVVSAAVFASQGHDVIGLDVDSHRIERLSAGTVPFFEPKLQELLQRTLQQGNLHFTTEYHEAIPQAGLIIIAVGTPSGPDGQADLQYVRAVSIAIAPHLHEDAIVAVKSTVPPGTCDQVEQWIRDAEGYRGTAFTLASLPEFLKEGTAVDDTLHPDRVVIGATDPAAIQILEDLHAPFGAPIVVMSPASAQMCKYTANSYLATRITFINQIADLCERNGASISEVIEGIGFDKRIGHQYWYPGLGYGGSCFPKDVKELAQYAKAQGFQNHLLVAIDALNSARIRGVLDRFSGQVGGLSGKKVAVLGLSFKPNTDDMREAASLSVIPYLLEQHATITAYDPQAGESARTAFLQRKVMESPAFRIVNSIDAALADADGVILLVEWDELVSLHLPDVAKKLRTDAFFFDTRNQYNPDEVRAAHLRYFGIGRPS